MNVSSERFALLDQGWLVVDGRWFDSYGQVWGDESLVLHRRPPADLVALVGKACDVCRGRFWDHDPDLPIGDCLTCHGTGSELLTAETECGCYKGTCTSCLVINGDSHPCHACGGDGTLTKLVRLTGQPVQRDDGTFGFPVEVIR